MTARQSPSGPGSSLLLKGEGLTVNPDMTLSPLTRPRRFYDWDYFLSGGLTASTIGRLSWTLGGNGTPTSARINSSYVNTSKYQFSTSGASGDRATVLLGDTEARAMCSPSEFANVASIWRPQGASGDKRVFWGWCDNFAIDPMTANNALGWNYDTTRSPFWQLINRVGGVELSAPFTASVLGIVPTNVGISTIIVQPDDALGSFDFYGNNPFVSAQIVHVARLQNPGFPANHGYRIETLTAAVARMDTAWWGMNSEILPGILSSDDFLER